MKCLIVDDSRTVRRVIRSMLEELDMNCQEAEDGEKAFEACATDMPDLIVLDWNMPNVTGIEFLENLRATANGTHPKVLFCTTENSMERIMKGMNAGADEYLMKPFDKALMHSKLQQLGIVKDLG